MMSGSQKVKEEMRLEVTNVGSGLEGREKNTLIRGKGRSGRDLFPKRVVRRGVWQGKIFCGKVVFESTEHCGVQ